MATGKENFARERGAFTEVLTELNRGEPNAFPAIVQLAYDDIRRIAAGKMKARFRQPLKSLTESPTSIANLAMTVLEQQRTEWENSDHFFAIAATLVVRFIIDFQRRRNAPSRGGGRRGASNEEILANIAAEPLDESDESVQLARCLNDLRKRNQEAAEVVALHFFCEMTLPAIGKQLKMSLSTVERRLARAKEELRVCLEARRTTP